MQRIPRPWMAGRWARLCLPLMCVALLGWLASSTRPAHGASPSANVPPPEALREALRPLSAAQRAGVATTPLEQVVANYRVELGISLVTPRDTSEPSLEAQLRYLEAREAWNQRDGLGTLRGLQAALALEPQRPALLAMLGRVFAAAQRESQAVPYLEKAVALAPGRTQDLLLLARLALSSEHGMGLDSELERKLIVWIADAVSQRPEAEEKDEPDANADVKEAEDTDESDGPLADEPDWVFNALSYYLARALDRNACLRAAATEYEAVLARIDNGSPDAATNLIGAMLEDQRETLWQRLGDLRHQLGHPRRALTAYERALELVDVPDGALISRLVYTHLVLDQVDRAKATVRSLLDDDGPLAPGRLSLVQDLLGYLRAQGVDTADLDAAMLHSALDAARGGRLNTVGDAGASSSISAALSLAVRRVDESVLLDTLGQPWLAGPERFARADVEGRRGMGAGSTLSGGEGWQGWERLGRTLLAELLRRGRYATVIDVTSEAIASDGVGGIAALSTLESALRASDPVNDTARALAAALPDGGDAASSASAGPRGLMLGLCACVLEDASLWPGGAPPGGFDSAASVWLAGRLAMIEGDDTRALRAAEDLADTAAALDPRVLAFRTDAYLATGRDARARSLIDEQLRRDPGDVGLLRLKARVLLQAPQPDYAQAEQVYLDAINLAPEDATLYEELIDRLYDPPGSAVPPLDRSQERWSALVRRLFAHAPDSAEARTIRFELAEAKREDALADALVRPLLKERPGYWPLWSAAAGFFERTRQWDELAGVLRHLIEHGRADAQQWATLISLYRAGLLGEASEAAAQVASLVERGIAQNVVAEDDLPAWLDRLGWAYEQMGKPEAIQPRIEQAIRRHPGLEADLTYRLAMLAERAGDAARAETLLLGVLEIDPDHPEANNHLAYTWVLQHKHLDRLLPMVTRALAADANRAGRDDDGRRGAETSENAAFLDTRGWVHYKLGEFDRAVIWLRRAVEAMGDERANPVVLDHLGDAYYRIDDRRRAVQMWVRAAGRLAAYLEAGFDDPEFDGLKARLEAKVRAVSKNEAAPVAEAAIELMDGSDDGPNGESAGESDGESDADVNAVEQR